ncbi:uncharacterized protein N7459_002060 [Penicillium hispanicum]|uniref:uncharacterized protein n=1 Tax=Penicillium hispanicum TaxID=1080232 RepID=UPI0025417E0C|nr:uncharacterized protein N7459_002060 [Penicillium hispanicum]KAJ5591691.1 hypothetical protein N7459_002060 [Penicillium hispanicum]
MAKTTPEDTVKIKINLSNMNPDQRAYLVRKNMEPITYFFRAQALACLLLYDMIEVDLGSLHTNWSDMRVYIHPSRTDLQVSQDWWNVLMAGKLYISENKVSWVQTEIVMTSLDHNLQAAPGICQYLSVNVSMFMIYSLSAVENSVMAVAKTG